MKEDETETWVGIHDFLGVEDPTWSPKKVKELLQDLIKSGFIFKVDEAVLYSFLLRKGVLNLANRHEDFFKNLIDFVKDKKTYTINDLQNEFKSKN